MLKQIQARFLFDSGPTYPTHSLIPWDSAAFMALPSTNERPDLLPQRAANFRVYVLAAANAPFIAALGWNSITGMFSALRTSIALVRSGRSLTNLPRQ